ncbi:hypothetical protein T484DRAFT_1788739 [Baffinella frigidus]|nr:hypothetical protein T484DRAFT_1788739 [Cryptophyta sp. CCMP2293]
MDSPGGRGEAWMGGVDPPMSPLPIGEEGCKVEAAAGGAATEGAHEAAVGHAVGLPVGVALARLGSAEGASGELAEPAPGGATPEVHEAAVGDAVGSPVGIALARTGTADPPPAGTKGGAMPVSHAPARLGGSVVEAPPAGIKAPAGDEGCSEIKAVPVDTKEGSELPAEGAAGPGLS